MEVLNVNQPPQKWKILLAFAMIYFVWGSAFFAIRIGVREFPPLIMAAMRFLAAGAVLFAWAFCAGKPLPSAKQWKSISILSLLIFVLDYGLLFWSEKHVPSGVAAVIMATIPAFMALGEIIFLKTQKLTARLGLALLIGLAGVGVLVTNTLHLGGAPVYRPGAIALVVASLAWSIASVSTRLLDLPDSKILSSGAQMLLGGFLLLPVAAVAGEFRNFHPSTISSTSWFALIYLVIACSIIGFTAYVWLISHESPTRVGTYAYVHPVVAVMLGYFFAGEPLGMRTVLGTSFVLISVLVITTARTKKIAPIPPE